MLRHLFLYTRIMKKVIIILFILLLVGCNKENETIDGTIIDLNNDVAFIDGEEIEISDYTWHIDQSVEHNEIKNAPAEYHTGSKSNKTIYIDSDLPYMPKLDKDKFELVKYGKDNEWVYYYEDGINNEYIFVTLPCIDDYFPEEMMFEKTDNKVLHINQEGTYILKGNWNGQINIDLGEEAINDSNSKVKLILDGVNINCDVAPAIMIENAYEDKDDAGIEIIVNANSDNVISGKNIFRMLKTKYKDDGTQKAIRKHDACIFSNVSININGYKNSYLEINSSYEGIGSKMHIGIENGNYIINSYDDAINANNDEVSIIELKDAKLVLNASLGKEGDGVDSNGSIIIDGADIAVNNIKKGNHHFDSITGVTYKSGKIIYDGKAQVIKKGTSKNLD